MDLQHTHFRSMIFYDFKSGLTQQQSHIRLKAAFGDEAPSTIMTGLPTFEEAGTLWKTIPARDAQLQQQQIFKWLLFRNW